MKFFSTPTGSANPDVFQLYCLYQLPKHDSLWIIFGVVTKPISLNLSQTVYISPPAEQQVNPGVETSTS